MSDNDDTKMLREVADFGTGSRFTSHAASTTVGRLAEVILRLMGRVAELESRLDREGDYKREQNETWGDR